MSSNIEGLRKLGVKAVGFNLAPRVFQSENNIYAISNHRNLLIRVFKNLNFCLIFFYHLSTATHVHWVYGSKSKVAQILLILLKLFRKKKVVEFCGSDVRSLEKMCADIEFFGIDRFDAQLRRQLGTEESSNQTQKRFKDSGFNAIFNSPELVDYVNHHIFPEFYKYNRSVIIKDITTDNSHQTSPSTIPKIVHIPSNPTIKGTDDFLVAAERLKREGIADFEIISGVSHSIALGKISNADIVVDQLVIGEYGVLSIEAMALGKPTVCFIRPKLWNTYTNEFESFPIVNANIINIYDVLKDLALKPNTELMEIGRKGCDFVTKYHSHLHNAKNLLDIYKTV